MELFLVLSANRSTLIDPTRDCERFADFQILEENFFGTGEVLAIECYLLIAVR